MYMHIYICIYIYNSSDATIPFSTGLDLVAFVADGSVFPGL